MTLKLYETIANEPAMLLAVIQAGLVLLVTFGIDLSDVQIGAVLTFSALVLGFITRSVVTPVLEKAQPKVDEALPGVDEPLERDFPV